jgi:hypothetical protein
VSTTAQLAGRIEKAIATQKTITLTRAADQKTFTGQLIRLEDGRLTVRTGQRGRPVRLTDEDVSAIVAA